jgi:hypothetical protein
MRTTNFARVTFDPVSDAPAEGAVVVFSARTADGSECSASEDGTTADYPSLCVAKPAGPTRYAWRIAWTTARWEACRTHKAVDVCAKQYPGEYANAKRLFELATALARSE